MIRWQHIIFFGGLAFVLAVLPSLYNFTSLEIYDEKRVFQAGLLILVGLLFIFTVIFKRPTPDLHRKHSAQITPSEEGTLLPKVAFLSIGLFLVLGLLRTWVNEIWYYGLLQLSIYLLLFVFFLYTARLYRQNPSLFLKGVWLVLFLFAGLYTLKFFIETGLHLWWPFPYPLWPDENQNAALYGWANIRFFNQVQAWTLPLLVLFVSVNSSDDWGLSSDG